VSQIPRPWLIVAALAAAVFGLVLARAGDGLQPYGIHGAHYIEHAQRIEALETLQMAPMLGLPRTVERLDGPFPPLLHLATGAVGAVTGHSAEAVAWTGLLWLALLVVAVAAVAARFDRRAAPVAAAAMLLLPAAHAFAPRYYYDLPMTALLWAAVAAALHGWRRPLLGGLVVGLLWLAANLLKWSSLPFAVFLLICCVPPPDPLERWRPRLLGLGVSGLVAGLGSLLYLSLAGPESSMAIQLDAMWGGLGQQSLGTGSLGGALAGFGTWLADKGVLMGARLAGAKPVFYGVQGITAVLSPAGALIALPLAALGLAHRRALPLTLGSSALQLLFLVGWIPVIDERFLLTSAPALLVLASLGWLRLPSRVQAPVRAAAIVLGLWVAADFHLGTPPIPGPDWEHRLSTTVPPLRGHGLGLADSAEQRGWSRRETTPDARFALREAVFAQVLACPADVVLLPDAPPSDAPAGQFHWFDYRARYGRLYGDARRLDFVEQCDDAEQADLALLPAMGEDPPQQRACIPPDWVERARFPVGESDLRMTLWGPPGRPCGVEG